MAIESVLQQVLKMPADERAEIIEHLIDSLEDHESSCPPRSPRISLRRSPTPTAPSSVES